MVGVHLMTERGATRKPRSLRGSQGVRSGLESILPTCALDVSVLKSDVKHDQVKRHQSESMGRKVESGMRRLQSSASALSHIAMSTSSEASHSIGTT
jgi:hypothetical protein